MWLGDCGPAELEVAAATGLAAPSDLVAWAVARLSVDDPELQAPEPIEIAGLVASEHPEAPALLGRWTERTATTIDPRSDEAERIARRLFARLCRDYLGGQATPAVLCTAVRTLDHTYDAPPWVTGLWHACDWVDETASAADLPHLAPGVERALERLGAGHP